MGRLDSGQSDDTYHRYSFDLSSLRHSTITLTIAGTEDAGSPAHFLVDDVSITCG